MIRRDACAVCGATDVAGYPAVVAPFVAERIGVEAEPCRLLECRRCGHRFYDLALDDAEATRFYADYRGEQYARARRRWEPWYSEDLNALGADGTTIANRRRLLDEYLRRWLPPAIHAQGGVLDYGGDRGQFIPPALGSARFVFDISNQPTHEGVVRLTEVEALRLQRFDVVLLAHVLEHLSEPLSFLRGLADQLGPRSAGHWLYAEVPYERFRILKRPVASGGPAEGKPPRRGLPWLLRDFYSTLFRVKLDVVPPLGVIKLHEHQGFFSEGSLRALLDRAGYSVVDVRVTPSGTGVPYPRVLRIIAQHVGGARSAAGDATGGQP